MGNLREAAKMNMENGRMLISRGNPCTNVTTHNEPHVIQPRFK
jgi:hypothetical protein